MHEIGTISLFKDVVRFFGGRQPVPTLHLQVCTCMTALVGAVSRHPNALCQTCVLEIDPQESFSILPFERCPRSAIGPFEGTGFERKGERSDIW